MNFKEYFTEASQWRREAYTGTHHKKIEPIEPHLTKYEKQLLNKWRETLKVGDRVDLIDKRTYMPGIMAYNEPITNIKHFKTNIPNQSLIFYTKLGSGGSEDFYPPGYMPGDLTKKQLSSSTLNTFGDLIDEL